MRTSSGSMATELPSKLWAIIGLCVNGMLHDDRTALAGEESNGFELCRKLHYDRAGGAKVCKVKGPNEVIHCWAMSKHGKCEPMGSPL